MSLRDARKRKGLTAKYVADKLGIRPTTLTRKERTNSFSVLQMQFLCNLYEVKVDEIDV